MANLSPTFHEETKSILQQIQELKEQGDILTRLHKCRSGLMSTHFEEIHTRFRLWAGNFGALHEAQNVCGLDRRLQDAPEIAQRIRSILGQLRDVLKKAKRTCPCETQENHKISVDDLGDIDIKRLLGTQASPPCLTSWIFTSLDNIVRRLFIVSPLIASVKSQDDFAHSEVRCSMQAYKLRDIAHVREKFSKTSSQIPWLVERLGRANTNRRQLIAYAKTRRMKLSEDTSNCSTPSTEMTAEHHKTVRCDETFDRDLTAHPEDHKTSHVQKSHSTDTSPSTESFEHECRDTQSCISGAASVIRSEFSSDAIVPELSQYTKPDEPFVCPVCCTEQRIDGQSLWRRHVFSDLRAYICTSRDCGLKMFDSFATWRDHEMEHRQQWFCPICDIFCKDNACTREHIIQHHGNLAEGAKLDMLLEVSSRALEMIPVSDCPFCCWDTTLLEQSSTSEKCKLAVRSDQFMEHVGRHLEGIALFVLPEPDGLHSSPSQASSDGIHDDTAEVSKTAPNTPLAAAKTSLSRLHTDQGGHAQISETSSYAQPRALPNPARMPLLPSLPTNYEEFATQPRVGMQDIVEELETDKEKKGESKRKTVGSVQLEQARTTMALSSSKIYETVTPSQMDSCAGHEASDGDSDRRHYLNDAVIGKAEAALKAKLSRKRTKTGCLTCRKRRVRCGEERPICKNCIKSKRHCEGYYRRVVFKPPPLEYRAAPNGGAHITFQAGPMATPMLSPHPGQMPQFLTDPSVYPDLISRSGQQSMQFVHQPVSTFAPPAPLMPFPGLGMPSQPVAMSHAVPLGYNSAMNGHQQQQAQPQFQTPFVPTYNYQLQQQQVNQTPSSITRTQSIGNTSQELPVSYFQTPTQIPRAYGVAKGSGILQALPSSHEQLWPSSSVPNVAPVQTPAKIPLPRKSEPMSASISLNESQAWATPTHTPHPELSHPIDYRPKPTTSEVTSRQPVAISPPSMPALASQNLSDPPTPEFFEQQAQFPENADYSEWLAEAAVEAVDDDYWDVESDEDMNIDKPTTIAQDTKRQRNLNKVIMGQQYNVPSLQIQRYDTFLQEGMLERYRVEWHANPLKNPATARVFAHFISATGPSMSAFERHPAKSSILFAERSVPLAQQGLWTYTMPMAALHHQGLLHAMLALSSLHIARLQNGDTTPSTKHYAWALKRIHSCISSHDSKKRLRVTTIAASMLLGFYEAMTANHMKSNVHLAGVKQLFVETDFAGMTRQYQQLKRAKIARDQVQLRKNSISTLFDRDDDINNQFNDVDEAMISSFVGREVRYEDQRGYVETEQSRIPQELDLSNFETLKDLFWWYCKQDAYQSVVSGNPLLMEYHRWADCPPRASMGRVDAVYGSFDHLILLLGRIADFASKDRVRKLRRMALQGGQWIPAPGMNISHPSGAGSGPLPSIGAGGPKRPSTDPSHQDPPAFFGMASPSRSNVQTPSSYNLAHQETSAQDKADTEMVEILAATAAALTEYGKIRAALKAFVTALSDPALKPLDADLQTPISTPFGSAIFYRSYAIACLWSVYNMCEIIAIRSHPHMHPAADAAADLATKDTAFYAEQIGRIAAGIVPGPANEPVNTTLGSSLCESCMPSFFAAIQYQRPDQRHFTVMRIYGIALRTGWGSAELIGKDIESSWVKAGETGRGPLYQKVEMPGHLDDPRLNRIWGLRTDFNTKPEEMDNSDRRLMTVKADAKLHWAAGVIGLEDDFGER